MDEFDKLCQLFNILEWDICAEEVEKNIVR